jgi:hypothetical protein
VCDENLVRIDMGLNRAACLLVGQIVLQNSKNGSDFSAKRAAKRQSPIDVSSSVLPKLPVSSSLVAVVPRTIFSIAAPTARRICVQRSKKSFATLSGHQADVPTHLMYVSAF